MKNEIIKIIKEVAKKQKINVNLSEENLNTPFKEIGIDSINVLGIIVAIEDKLGYRLDDSILAKIKTANELIAAFEQCKK